MKKNTIKNNWIALLLSLILVVGSLPINAVALQSSTTIESNTANDTSEFVTDSQDHINDEANGKIIEITSLREENVKHFRLADGTYEAVVYTQPVHRKDKNGIWQDIDNSLTLEGNEQSQKYKTLDSRVIFSNSFKMNEELFTLSENGYSISMMLIGSETSSKMSSTAELQLSIESNPIVSNTPKRTNGKAFTSLNDATKIDNSSSIVYNR